MENSDYFHDFSSDYQNNLKICESGSTIPQISENDAFKLIQKMKPNVDYYFGVITMQALLVGSISTS